MKRIKRTRQDVICENLKRIMGLREVKGRSRKYRVFEGGRKYQHQNFYAGKSGALRLGPSISDSISVTHKVNIAKWRKDLEILDELS